MARSFIGASTLTEGGLALALAPALTPVGPTSAPSFFHGFATQPQVLARGLVTLADVTATRYFQFSPTKMHDPVLTAQGDRLRAECFSACNSVYVRLDLFSGAFEAGEIARGTTNVDIGTQTRALLSNIARDELLHLDIGVDQLAVGTLDHTAVERRVEMPDRWVRALGNAAEVQRDLSEGLRMSATEARTFIASLPPATGKTASGWLTKAGGSWRLAARSSGSAVYLSGLHRLSGLKRVLMHVTGITVYGPGPSERGPVLVSADLPDARLTLGLTEEAWRGFSGEGALLSALATPTVLDDADLVGVLLAFEPVIDVARLARESALSPARVEAALAVLATSGRVGWDAHDGAYFHRELPDDPDRVTKDNPRLVGAEKLVEAGVVQAEPGSTTSWLVGTGDNQYAVRLDPAALAAGTPTEGARCTCPWYLRHTGGRGPCKHVLAVQLVLKGRS